MGDNWVQGIFLDMGDNKTDVTFLIWVIIGLREFSLIWVIIWVQEIFLDRVIIILM